MRNTCVLHMVIWAGLLTVVGMGCLDFLKIGPGLPPTEMMAPWYIPGHPHESFELNVSPDECTDYFCTVKFYNDVGYPIFPEKFNIKSDDRAYAIYKKGNNTYIIASYYFRNEKILMKEISLLKRDIKNKGKVYRLIDNFSVELVPNSPDYTTIQLNVTKFETPNEIGYIFVYHRPFLNTRKDAFLVYYAARKNTDDQKRLLADLHLLIGKSYYMANQKGKVTGIV